MDFPITPRASWMGGSWERMVKSVKHCLKKTLGRSLLTFEEITTIVCEIEAVLNDRPITYCYDDEGGISYPLTPSELINGRCLTKLNDRVFEIINTNEALTKKVRYHRNLLRGFTNRWQTEYLQSLQEVSSKPGSKSSNIEIGEVVVIKDENSPLQMWKLGHIAELIKSDDGLIRPSIVRTNTKEGKVTLLKRAVKHLVPLEIRTVETSDTKRKIQKYVNKADDSKGNEQKHELKRERRTAACIGEILRRESDKL